LTDRSGEINECEIGRSVLGRRAQFDPREDNIVRVQARHLREKLEHYFETDGKDELLVITIPKGTYVPTFEPRLSRRGGARTGRWFLPSWPLGWKHILGLVLLAVLAVIAARSIWKVAWHPSQKIRDSRDALQNILLSRVFRTGESTKIVISDVGLVILQEYLHRTIALQEYLRDDYPHFLLPSVAENDARATLDRASVRPYTSYSDFGAANKLLQFGQRCQAETVIRHPRQLNIRDFETSNLVLLGGPLAVPWYRLFEPSLNFVFEVDYRNGTIWIRNKAPKSGEQQLYFSAVQPNAEETFAIIAVLPNLRNSGQVLLLAGMTMEGTEAASNMILREELPPDLQHVMRQARGQGDIIEILLRAGAIAGVARDSKIEAYRIRPAEIRP